MANKRQVVTNSLPELDEIAKSLSGMLRAGDVVCLDGELGSGKSQFVRFVCNNLGFEGEVTSPTYCFLNEYEIGNDFFVYHFDLYRLQDESQLSEVGFDDYGYCPRNGVAFVEWASLFEEEMPEAALHVHFSGNGDEPRVVTATSNSERADKIIEGWGI